MLHGHKKYLRAYGPLILRAALGAVMIVHGYDKLFNIGPQGVAGFLESLGVFGPVFFAWIISLIEFVGGILVVLGLFTRKAALLFAIDMIFAIILVHGSNGFFVSNVGYEFAMMNLAAALALMFLGAGRYSLDWHFFCKGKDSSCGCCSGNSNCHPAGDHPKGDNCENCNCEHCNSDKK